ncbi:MAG: hypothetical protein J0L96_06940 [Anaerolineae bacterium]|nr:hypothetical protein [Anaerolineae bacterium]
MTLTSKPLTVMLFVILFGGIALSSAMGWWATESTKKPTTFTEGGFAGLANPADIRGSYTFGDIANAFDITPEILAQAFDVSTADPAAFAVKDLEAIYLDSGFEIGTNSVRMFVAFYTGLPFDLTVEETVMPQTATDILLAKGNLTPAQVSYLETHTINVSVSAPVVEPVTKSTPVAEETHVESTEEYTIKGKTTFGDLILWGVPKEIIETLIGADMPDPAMKVKDYASANGLDFETLKTALQAEVDKVKP